MSEIDNNQEVNDVDPEIINSLKKSRDLIGEFNPILEDTDKEVLSGRHRIIAGWRKKQLIDTDIIATEISKSLPFKITRTAAKEIIKLHANHQHRPSQAWTRQRIETIADEIKRAQPPGVPVDNTANIISFLTGFTHKYILELLPEGFKDPAKVKAGVSSGEVRQEIKKIRDQVNGDLEIVKPLDIPKKGLDINGLHVENIIAPDKTLNPKRPEADQDLSVKFWEPVSCPHCLQGFYVATAKPIMRPGIIKTVKSQDEMLGRPQIKETAVTPAKIEPKKPKTFYMIRFVDTKISLVGQRGFETAAAAKQVMKQIKSSSAVKGLKLEVASYEDKFRPVDAPINPNKMFKIVYSSTRIPVPNREFKTLDEANEFIKSIKGNVGYEAVEYEVKPAGVS